MEVLKQIVPYIKASAVVVYMQFSHKIPARQTKVLASSPVAIQGIISAPYIKHSTICFGFVISCKWRSVIVKCNTYLLLQ